MKDIIKDYPNASDLGKVKATIGSAYEKLNKVADDKLTL